MWPLEAGAARLDERPSIALAAGLWPCRSSRSLLQSLLQEREDRLP